jgi:regulator of sirC expression with transglutaminase-like and TPR domain
MSNGHLLQLKAALTRTNDLLEPALLIAQAAYPDLPVQAYLNRVNAWADALLTRAPRTGDLGATLGLLNHYMFEELKFRGNGEEYYDPRNSYVNEVMDRKLGIPITLSVVYIELGRRLGLALQGVSFPGHFLVKLRTEEGELALDPYNRGQMLGAPALRRRLADLFNTDIEDPKPYLATASRKEILVRLLGNLKTIYRTRSESDHLLRAIDQTLIVDPDHAEEYRDRGLLLMELSCPHGAIVALQEYLRRRPNAQDVPALREKLLNLKQQYGRLN